MAFKKTFSFFSSLIEQMMSVRSRSAVNTETSTPEPDLNESAADDLKINKTKHNMRQKYLNLAFIFALTGSMSISCSEDIPDCPSKMCIIAGEWQLVEVFVDGAKDTEDLSNYRLELIMPAPTTATTSGFTRIQPSGISDDGQWSVENNGTILRLIPDNNPVFTEDWIIESLTPRKMILVINRDTGIKEGPSKIEFVLEPF